MTAPPSPIVLDGLGDADIDKKFWLVWDLSTQKLFSLPASEFCQAFLKSPKLMYKSPKLPNTSSSREEHATSER